MNTRMEQKCVLFSDDMSGPMMVMEYCADSLKEWLSRNKGMQLDGNTEECLITFSSDIAKGVAELHRHGVGVHGFILAQTKIYHLTNFPLTISSFPCEVYRLFA
eukprot:GHVU01080594.1.p1 GENE.GHVU01080594.1~~GHVU01080594.1.p1  ORF type:complete len:104 (+),score=14.78 GHVU01080594.1:382-693(+)